MSARTPRALIILDGWGYREERRDNAIAQAETPNWDRWWREAPHGLVSGSGLDVGLPEGQMGNSEVGHMSLGAGRIIYQTITRINVAIADGSFTHNPAYCTAIDAAVAGGGAVHVLGLLSPGGVHSHEDQVLAAVRLAAGRGATVYLHAFLDGRDTPPRSALPSLQKAEACFAELGNPGRLASVVGRYYAMDRDQRWDRQEAAYRLLTEGSGAYAATSASAALEAAYARGEDDEFVKATTLCPPGAQPAAIGDGDAVLFLNFRADRARQLTRSLTDPAFSGFDRQHLPRLAGFVATTQYDASLDVAVAFPPDTIEDDLGALVASHGLTQLRMAETEKYAHVTFFFSGGREASYPGEDRVMVASPKVATYDLQPEMSAPELTDRLCEAIRSCAYDLIVCNYANGDMVGHTGHLDAAIKAVATLDHCLGQVEDALAAVGGEALITADHGNCEQMRDYDADQPHTQHTTELVPLVYLGPRAASLRISATAGRLADIAPSLLTLMGLPQPAAMTGRSLIDLG